MNHPGRHVVSLSNILVVTFTRNASAELKGRVAKALGCTPSALSKIENGRVTPKTATILRIFANYTIPLARFYCLPFEPSDF
ncbi:MAG: helix-turn-helix domain-containing protein [Clostridia bacterium]|nr:helix-turn-helix domain-containing protein [Clostridia bacterium]